jgi:hypothetical protein
VAGCHDGHPVIRIIAEASEGIQAHVAAMRGSLVPLLEQYCADNTEDAGFERKVQVYDRFAPQNNPLDSKF